MDIFKIRIGSLFIFHYSNLIIIAKFLLKISFGLVVASPLTRAVRSNPISTNNVFLFYKDDTSHLGQG